MMGSQVEFSPDTKPGSGVAHFDTLQALPDASDNPTLSAAMSPTGRRTRGEPRLGAKRASRRSVVGRDESLPGMVNVSGGGVQSDAAGS
jgi:hypothetical protein